MGVRQPGMPKDGIANDWWRIYTLLQTSLSVGPGVLMEFNRLVDLVTETNDGDLQWGWHCKEEMWRADMLLLPWFPYLCMACTLNVGCWNLSLLWEQSERLSSSLLLLESWSPLEQLCSSGSSTAVAVEWALEAWVSTTGCFSSLTSHPRMRWLSLTMGIMK